MTRLPTLRQLQFFVALARRESFSRAAEDCLVSQSTLSAAIKELELVLAMPLVDRTGKSFSLTPVGGKLVPRAEALLTQAEDMTQLGTRDESLSGVVKLGMIPTIGPFVLPEAQALFEGQYPDLSFYLREDLTATLVSRLQAGLLDVVLMAFPYELTGIETLIFAEDPFYFVCPQGHRLAERKRLVPSDLDEEKLLLLEDGHCLRDHALSACQLQSRHAANMVGGTSLFTLTQMVRSGFGTTLLPRVAVIQGLAATAGLQVVPFQHNKENSGPSRQLGLAWRKGSGFTQTCTKMAKIFCAVTNR